jgi:hypothetical protein
MKDIDRGRMEESEDIHSLEVIRTHIPIPSIPMQTFQTSRRSLLTRIEELSWTFTGLMNGQFDGEQPFLSLHGIERSTRKGIQAYLSNF